VRNPDANLPSGDTNQNQSQRPDTFARLQQRGIDYARIKRIVQFECPQDRLLFAQWFKGRTIKQVLKQAAEWKAFLKKDVILSLSPDLKAQVERFVVGTELLACRALMEGSARVGPLDLRIICLPTRHDEQGRPVFINPDREIVAVHRETKEERRARLPGSRDLALQAEDLERAYKELRLWDQLSKGDLSRKLISKRSPQGWPVYTRLIIPRLYELMVPHYPFPGHRWARHGTKKGERLAQLPTVLLEDMLEILRLEHLYAFEQMTVPQLKAILQRDLARENPRNKSKKWPKN